MKPLRSLRWLTGIFSLSSAPKRRRRPDRPLGVEWLEPRQMLSTIIDDGGAGYSAVGSWLYSSGQGYGGDVRYSALGSGNDVARWTFNVTPGPYRVSASWFAHSNRASDAPYTILDGSNVLGTVRVNQKLAANDVNEAGTNWEYLGGPYDITSNTLVVTLSDAANGYVIADAVRIEPIVVSPIQIIDNGNAGFSKAGNWPFSSGQGYGGDVHYSAMGSGSDVARWTFAVTPGRYRVSASWFAHANRASNAPYTIFNGSTALGTVRVSQKVAANDFSAAGTNWEDLGGPYDITGNTLVMELSDAANGYVIADAVRIEAQASAPPTIYAASCSSADVQTAINSAADGQIVQIPNGSCTWAAGSVTISGKGIHLKGQTKGSVNITGNTGTGDVLQITKDASHHTEISNIDFLYGSGTGRYINISGTGKIPLLHDNYFDANGTLIHIIRFQTNGGVFWKNTVEAISAHLNGVIQINPGTGGDAEWAAAHTIGTADITGTTNTYFEDNTFIQTLQQSVDGSNGARVVLRYNTMIDAAVVMHGFDTDQNGGARHWEFYNNTFTRISSNFPINRWFYLRGATGVITDNVIAEASSPDGFSYPNKAEIDMTVQNLRRNSGIHPCWNSGYPAPHQVGQLTNIRDTTPDFPVAIWNNTGAGTGSGNFISLSNFSPDQCGGGPPVTDYIQSGRDYITSAPSAYTKFTYPHPLRT